MQVYRFAIVAMAAALASVVPAYGQRVEVQPVQPGRLLVRGDVSLLAVEAVEKLKLTAEQKDKYAKLDTEYKEKSKSAQDKFIEDVKGNRDREKIKEANDKLQADKKKLRDDLLAKVEPILTAEQKTVFAQVKVQQPTPNPGVIRRPDLPIVGGGVGQVLPPGVQQRLNLTDDQKKQIADIQKEVEAKVLKVLTDEQKKQFEEMKKGVIRIQPIRPVQPNPAIRNPQPAPQPAVEPRKQN